VIIHKLISLETVEDNILIARKQRYKYNQSLLTSNPVSSSSLPLNGYLKDQHKLFISLISKIETSINDIQINNDRLKGEGIIKFVIDCTAQCYLPMLLNVQSQKIPLILNEFCQLLEILESATGKHNITFGDYLNERKCEYDDMMEKQYLLLFHQIILKLKDASSNISSNNNKEELCKEIIELLTPECNIMKVLLSQFNIEEDSVVIVNNILSWIDNMLNVVYTIINFLVLLSCSNIQFNKEYYKSNFPRARALATMFMRQALSDFNITASDGTEVEFHMNDVIMMSNGNEDTVFGGNGRKCPSKPWSFIFVERMVKFITDNYHLHNSNSQVKRDPNNDSWFWNKFSIEGLTLTRHH